MICLLLLFDIVVHHKKYGRSYQYHIFEITSLWTLTVVWWICSAGRQLMLPFIIGYRLHYRFIAVLKLNWWIDSSITRQKRTRRKIFNLQLYITAKSRMCNLKWLHNYRNNYWIFSTSVWFKMIQFFVKTVIHKLTGNTFISKLKRKENLQAIFVILLSFHLHIFKWT